MGDLSQLARAPRPAIAIIGGAVSGAETAGAFADRGALCVVFEQNRRPYGKIEDGLPRWHEKLRDKECATIDTLLDRPDVLYVPCTALGPDLSLSELRERHGFSAVVLANGAWRDRPIGVPGADAYLGRGLVYQNPLVHWFNHHQEPGYDGPQYELPAGTIVVGGGLASVDVAKLINVERCRGLLQQRGIEVSVAEIEHAGIPELLGAHGLEPAGLGMTGTTIYYRRRVVDMPVAFPRDDSPAALDKARGVRAKLIEIIERKFLVEVAACHRAVGLRVEDGRLRGLRFVRTEIQDGRVVDLPDTELEVVAPLVVSSIGSVPEPIDGVPMRGELYDFEDWDAGTLRGLPGVHGLGNVLTGKGNIKDSRRNADAVSARILEAQALQPASVEAQQRLLRLVQARWDAVGYDGDYRRWVARD